MSFTNASGTSGRNQVDRQHHATSPAHLVDLNEAQRRAVTFGVGAGADRSPPLLVIAGAGTGKTKTLTHRVAHLIMNGAHPSRILLLTFARRMALEMTRRVEHLYAQTYSRAPGMACARIEWSGTFHAIGAKLLRLYATQIGLDASFSILDRADAEDLLDLVRDDLGLSRARSRFPKKSTCLAIYSAAVNAEQPLSSVLARAFPWCAEWQEQLIQLFAAYVEAKQVQNALDYDDLLLYWAQMMTISHVAASVASRFDHVLVDEYQDTNALQASILLRLRPDGTGLTVVGDDAQSIYSFRSATVRNILDFPGRFEPAADVLMLEENYRSTGPILEACNRVMAHAPERYGKSLYCARKEGAKPVLATVADETAQVDLIVERVLANREEGMDLRDQAVLMRASHHSGQLEIELTRRNIPFIKFGGLKFLEAAHVKDVIAILRWAENPKDEIAALRVLKLVPGMGPSAARRAYCGMQGEEGFLALARFDPPRKAADAFGSLASLMRGLQGSSEWRSDIDRLRGWYDGIMELVYDNVLSRRGDLEQLGAIAAGHASRTSFLTDLALDPPQATGTHAGPPVKDEDWLVLSTIHSAKGQEWRAVMILNVVDGCIPSDLATGSADEIEEERRLLYVAMTRAREDLVLVQPLKFSVRGQSAGGDRHVFAPRSRFIEEADLGAFDILAPRAAPAASDAHDSSKPVVDLRATMRQMWR